MLTTEGFDETSEEIFDLSLTSPLQLINYQFLLLTIGSQTTLDAKLRLQMEKIRRLILLTEPLVNFQKMIIPATKNLFSLQGNEN